MMFARGKLLGDIQKVQPANRLLGISADAKVDTSGQARTDRFDHLL